MNPLETASAADELIHKARAAFHSGHLTVAGRHLSAALALAPDAELALALGHIKFSAGGVYEALQEYAKAARLDPQCAAAHACRALALQLLGYARDARAAAEQALVLDPSEPTDARVLARMRLDSQNCGGIRTSCQNILDGYMRPLTQALCGREEELCPA
jgi:tetratricopeptide (TPR) repeat protein